MDGVLPGDHSKYFFSVTHGKCIDLRHSSTKRTNVGLVWVRTFPTMFSAWTDADKITQHAYSSWGGAGE